MAIERLALASDPLDFGPYHAFDQAGQVVI
jgi:hypothetical protein